MRTLPNFCRSFRAEAHKVWEDMSEAEALDISRDEETTTQDLLLSLARKHRGRGLDIKTFTKTEESVNGADWAFWFAGYSGAGIGVRIQAKRFFSSSGRYKSLYHQSDKQRQQSAAAGLPTPNQCEALLTHRDGLVPVYVFYNSNTLNIYDVHRPHRNLIWWHYCFPYHDRDWGISAASALAVRQAKWGKNDRPGDFPMVPWHCLLCSCCWDERPADASLPSMIGYGLQQMYEYSSPSSETEEDDRIAFDYSFEPTDNTPAWVWALQDGDGEENVLNEEMARLNLKGVAVISEAGDRDV